MESEKTRGHDRTRIWAVVVYPDSAPDNWREILDDYHIEWAESPLHEFDTNQTGELKKPHWHIILAFDGPKSYEQVLEILSPLNCPIPQRCHSLKGAVRYFVHLDNPEKYQYSISDIVAHGGFDISDLLRPSSSERYTLIAEILDFVDAENIVEFQDLLKYARKEKFDTWFPLLCDNSAYVVGMYIKSQRHRNLNS